ncbi:Helicase associated domain protein [Pseudoalteromonas nigrifaciens]|nr:Helicase associated domain protein [Pseudoalteromonas nigrifaciens]
MLNKLWRYYLKFGTLVVASRYDKQLQQWTGAMRQQQKNGTLSIERKKCLDEIGFNWEPQISNFKERYKQLIEFQKKYGHTDVTYRNGEFIRLGEWVREQRAYYKQKVLAPYKIKMLNDISFTWNFKRDEYRYKTELERSLALLNNKSHER